MVQVLVKARRIMKDILFAFTASYDVYQSRISHLFCNDIGSGSFQMKQFHEFIFGNVMRNEFSETEIEGFLSELRYRLYILRIPVPYDSMCFNRKKT